MAKSEKTIRQYRDNIRQRLSTEVAGDDDDELELVEAVLDWVLGEGGRSRPV
jgi:hypothetical protein